jgi:predicted Zn-dependent protease
MRTLIRCLVVPALLLGPAGCTVNPATGKQSFTAFMSPAEEEQVGAEQHQTVIRGSGGVYADKALADYIDRIGQSLVAQSEQPAAGYSFTILDDDSINAFALPGGYIYITRGLLALASNEAEVAGVLAHELGHVVARHAAQRYSRSMATGLGLAFGIPPVAGDLAGLGAQVWLQDYSRDQELEADQLAVRYMTRAGYDPEAMVTLFRKLDADARLQAALVGDPGAADRFNIMASHPRTADRLRQVSSLAKTAQGNNQRLNQDAYLARIDGLAYGDARKDGIRRGREFVHPDLRTGFRVPPGFVLQNTPQQVVAVGPQQSLIIFSGERPEVAAGAGSMTNYLARVWGARANLQAVEGLTIDGLDAATASSRASTRQGTVDVRLTAIRTGSSQIYRFIFLSRPDLTPRLTPAFQETERSFRRLSEQEAASIRPLVIRIVPVKPGDTVETLAAAMPFPGYNDDLFRILNGLDGQAPLVTGRAVKVVSDGRSIPAAVRSPGSDQSAPSVAGSSPVPAAGGG